MRSLPPLIRWSPSSSVLLGGFLIVVFLITYIWWPLAEQVLAYVDWRGAWWLYMDWLLLGLFLFMSLTIVARADLRRDSLIIFVATIGGLVIEAWGTQTNLWHYYTSERPPLWIVPAWPIATLSIDRITRALEYLIASMEKLRVEVGRPPAKLLPTGSRRTIRLIGGLFRFRTWYWIIFAAFLALMAAFVAPTFDKPYTILAALLCIFLVLTPTDRRRAGLVFIAGSALGYFLELWGTTRECWTYYTFQTPPLFAVLAHGMAAVAFWRTGLVLQALSRRMVPAWLSREVAE
jgi:hypothetical protein